MTKNGLIVYTNAIRGQIEQLRESMLRVVENDGTEDDSYLPLYEEECGCNDVFICLTDALDDFIHRLEEKQDLPEGTLVMCQPPISVYWKPQLYVGKGVTKPAKDSTARQSGWLYVVPLNHFHPDTLHWKPAESYNWANFGEEEK